MKLVTPTVVTLAHWQDRLYGDRWAVIFEGRSLRICGTEFEARRYCRTMGWTIDEEQTREGWG